MHRFYQFQLDTVIMRISLCTFSWITFSNMEIYCTDSKRPGKVNKRENLTDQKSLSILSLQTDYLNIDNSSGSSLNNKRENLVKTKCTFCGAANHSAETCFKRLRNDK